MCLREAVKSSEVKRKKLIINRINGNQSCLLTDEQADLLVAKT